MQACETISYGMSAAEYQQKTKAFAVYAKDVELPYLSLGLCAEAGEVADKIAKYYRGDKGLSVEEVGKELGDCLWFISQLCNRWGISMEELMQENIEKLADRQARNKLKGSGDNR